MRFNKRYFLFNIALAVLITSLIFFLSQQGLLRRVELAGIDLSFRLRGPLHYNNRVVIIEISDWDINKVGLWPWKRSWHAALTKALHGLGAKYVYFDFIFSEAASEEEDSLLENVIKEYKNVYLPFAFQDVSCNIENAFSPIKRFSAYMKGTGAVNIYPDIDGSLRDIPLVFREKQDVYPHIALQIPLDYLGLKIEEIKPHFIRLSGTKEKFDIPLIKENTFFINWLGKWAETFKHYSFLEVLNAYQELLEHKKPKIGVADLKDSICLVGLTATGLYDIKPVPLEPAYPGVGVVATTISNILDKKFIFPVANWISILILYLLSLIPALLIAGEKPLKETMLVFLVGIAYFVVQLSLFKRGIMLNLSSPLLGLFISFLVVEIYNFVRVSLEKQSFFKLAITDGLTGLFNIRYFKMLLETEIITTKSDPAKKFCILMSDIDHFKKFNDTYGHQVGDLVLKRVAQVLKSSVRSSDIVARYGGEEMIALLRGSSLKDGLNVAEKLRKNIEDNKVWEGNKVYQITVSIGIANFNPADSSDIIIKRADDGLYKAKNSGRNRVSTVEEAT